MCENKAGKYRYQNAQGHMKKADASLKTGYSLEEFLIRGHVQRGRKSTSCFGYMYKRQTVHSSELLIRGHVQQQESPAHYKSSWFESLYKEENSFSRYWPRKKAQLGNHSRSLPKFPTAAICHATAARLPREACTHQTETRTVLYRVVGRACSTPEGKLPLGKT
jgi:hypothetical protein